jgi:flagellar protein FlbB
MERNRRIFFLLLINLTLAFISLYVLDFLQIIDYRQIFTRVPGLRTAYKVKIEDPFLLEKVELEKKWQVLNERIRNFEEERRKLEEEARNLELERENLVKERQRVENMIAQWERERENLAEYDVRVARVANQIENMPPDAAVRIVSQFDDMMIIDVFRKIEERAEAEGIMSMVPLYLSMMDEEQAARVQQKILIR